MIGLKRHTVLIVEHDTSWAALFKHEAQAIWQAGNILLLDVQHVGSTAVQGLPAKPILDIAAAVGSSADIEELVKRLTGIGYIDRGDQGADGGYLMVRDSEPDVRTVHLHIVEQSDPQWRYYITFRDILRRDAGIRQLYGELKQKLASLYPNDRMQYTAGKNEFILRVLGENTQNQ